ncbi:MAG: uracil-DNA glycosylase [Alphaproteobacteria bacterium]|nr:uracil-DNA glycosylase [Alphaproteobacteria bacterium]
MTASPDPPHDCARCPRLAAYRMDLRAAHPDWWNAPVPGWGDPGAALLIVGMAPGRMGANRTGRPFTGDASGELLFATLAAVGLLDGARLRDAFITNAAACVPPQNKLLRSEAAACRPFLSARINGLPNLKTVVAIGRDAHDSVLAALGARLTAHPFAHGAIHRVGGLRLHDSYHCSRLNTNTGRLTPAMFEAVFRAALA